MKHCRKHNQKYYDYLYECPICVGEDPEVIKQYLYKNIQPENIIKKPEQNKTKFKRKLTGFKL